jgi:hypothetical protein
VCLGVSPTHKARYRCALASDLNVLHLRFDIGLVVGVGGCSPRCFRIGFDQPSASARAQQPEFISPPCLFAYRPPIRLGTDARLLRTSMSYTYALTLVWLLGAVPHDASEWASINQVPPRVHSNLNSFRHRISWRNLSPTHKARCRLWRALCRTSDSEVAVQQYVPPPFLSHY